MPDSVTETRFERGARFVMVCALVLLVGSIAQILYRFTLPTDGWSVLTEEILETNWLYYTNLVGADSGLQRDDALLAVDGTVVQGTATSAYLPAPPNWQVGKSVTMVVRRDQVQLEMAVPVVHWTAAAFARYNVLDPVRFTQTLGALLLLAVGWFTFLRRPEVPSARALLLLSTAIGATFISGVLPDGLSVQFNRLAYYLTAFFSYIIFGAVLAPSLLAFALLFPRPKQVIQRHPWLALLPFAYGGLLFLFLAAGGPGEAGWFSTLGMFALSIASLIHAGLTQRDPVSRAQLRWAISGFVLGLGLFLLNFPLAFELITDPVLVNLMLVAQSLGFLVIGLALAVAVLRYRLFDIDVIIRKTLIYAVLTVLLILVYFGSVVLLQQVFGQVTGVEQSPLAVVVSTLLIAALFTPLRRRIQDWIDRRFFRKKYDAQQVLAQFALTARDETDLDALTAEVVRVVQEAIQPERVTVWLKEKIT